MANFQAKDATATTKDFAASGAGSVGDPHIPSKNIAQIAGTTTAVGAGASNAGTQRVILAADQSLLTVTGSVGILGVIDTELPAAALLGDDTVNPTVPGVGGFLLMYDGATWDRVRGNSVDGVLVNLGANNDVYVTGTVVVSATDLDIRNLAQATDNVAIGDGTDLVDVLASGSDNLSNDTNQLAAASLLYGFDGTAWDRIRGDDVNGLLVNLGANNDVSVSGSVSILGSVDTELPPAALLTDDFANPTAPAVGSFVLVYDGSTWDRLPGNSTDGALVNLGANNDVSVSGSVSINGSVDTELPAAAPLTNDFANPTAPAVGAFLMGLDGSAWDRLPGNITHGLLVNTGANNTVIITGTVVVDTELPAAAALADGASATPTTPTIGAVSLLMNATTLDRQRSTINGLDSVGTGIVAAGLVGQFDDVSPPTITENRFGNLRMSNAGILYIGGSVAQDGAAGGNPVPIGASAETMADSAPANRVSADGDISRLSVTDGALFVIPTGPQRWSYHENSASALTDAEVHAAPSSGLSLYVTDITISIGAATAFNFFLEETTTTVFGPHYLEAVNGRGIHIRFGTPKKITAATALTITTSAAISHGIDIAGFIAPG
jgi:hypothetical protein